MKVLVFVSHIKVRPYNRFGPLKIVKPSPEGLLNRESPRGRDTGPSGNEVLRQVPGGHPGRLQSVSSLLSYGSGAWDF